MPLPRSSGAVDEACQKLQKQQQDDPAGGTANGLHSSSSGKAGKKEEEGEAEGGDEDNSLTEVSVAQVLEKFRAEQDVSRVVTS